MKLRTLVLVCAVAASGCFGPPSRGQRLTDSAYEVSNGMRFGRLDLALEHVAPKERPAFLRRRAHWGKQVRIVDIEFAGMTEVNKDDADVMLAVSWLRADEAVVRTTFIAQRWREDRGWTIIGESRQGGDFGLFGEPTPPSDQQQAVTSSPTSAPHEAAQLRSTRVIQPDDD
jgi:hypothetical protein